MRGGAADFCAGGVIIFGLTDRVPGEKKRGFGEGAFAPFATSFSPPTTRYVGPRSNVAWSPLCLLPASLHGCDSAITAVLLVAAVSPPR